MSRRARTVGPIVAIGLIGVPLSLAVAQTKTAPSDAPQQLAGLFMQSCLPFAGDPTALRSWARRTGLTELPDQARVAFLHGAQGVAFDASTRSSKLVVASSNDGICSVITNAAASPDVVAAMESDLTRAGIAYRLVIERNDKQIPALHDREYLASRDHRAWRILVATETDAPVGEAMLTTAPE